MNNIENEKLKPSSIRIYNRYNYSFISKVRDTFFDMQIFIINIVSFILLYYSFTPLSSYIFPVSYFLYPIDLISFIFLLVSSFISSYIIALIFTKKVKYIHILYCIIYYIIIFYIHHNKPIGNSSYDQSFIIFYVYIFLNIQNIFLYFLFQTIKYFFSSYNKLDVFSPISPGTDRDKKTIKFIFNIIILISFPLLMHILLVIKKKELLNCDNWDVGLNGTKINNDNLKYSCQIQKPEGYCYMDYFKGYFDLTEVNNRDCSLRNAEDEKKNFMHNLKRNNNINESTKIFGFPYTNIDEKFSLKNQKDIRNFGFLVNNDIFDLTKQNNYKNLTPEAILDFSENNIYNGEFGELKINLNFNKELSKDRKLLENSNSLYDNILMIYIDATSRAHFQRSFPKLSDFIKNFMSYDPSSKNDIKAYQFMKYHSFGPYTKINILPMFYGSSMKSNKGTHNVKYFKENGFITGHVVDMCNKEQYDIFLDENENIEYVEWDHENVAYLCDGNYFEINEPYQNYKGPYSRKVRCLYGHPVSYYMIEYTKQFWESYFMNKKYFRIAFNYGHEKTGAVVSYLDEPLYEMVFDFYVKGYLDKTALFIVSDHGNQNFGIYDIINNSEFELEKKFGLFFLLLWQNKRKKILNNFEENLLNNQQIMLTPYDIHDTMIHILYGNLNDEEIKSKYSMNDKGKSVFKYIQPKDRNCKFYDDWYSNFCGCI